MLTYKDFAPNSVIYSIRKGNSIKKFSSLVQRLISKILYRAQNRIAYLRKKIKTGRGKRFYQLKLVATQRKRKHDRLLENSYWYQFKCWFNHSVWNSSEIMCNGCDKEVKKKSLHVMNFDNTTCFICADCMKDVA